MVIKGDQKGDKVKLGYKLPLGRYRAGTQAQGLKAWKSMAEKVGHHGVPLRPVGETSMTAS